MLFALGHGDGADDGVGVGDSVGVGDGVGDGDGDSDGDGVMFAYFVFGKFLIVCAASLSFKSFGCSSLSS